MVHVSWICQNFDQWHLSLFLQCFLGVSHTHNPQEEIKESFQIAHQGRFAASTAIEEGHMIRKLHHQCSVVQHYVPQPFYAWTLNILPRRTLFVMFWCLKNYRRSPFKIHYPQIIWKKTNLTSLQWILVDHSKGDRNPWGLCWVGWQEPTLTLWACLYQG